MGVLEQIMQMKAQGIPDNEIVSSLQEQGISPRQINDALDQVQIKKAVTDEETNFYPPQNQEVYSPQTQEIQQQQYAPTPQDYTQQAEQYYQEPYAQNYNSGDYQASTADNTIEIAEQVFNEKIKTIQNTINKLNEFQTLAQAKIENISERLKRIEVLFDSLQLKILERVGAYGKNIDSMKKEITMIEDSFGKIAEKRASRQSQETTNKKKRG